MFEIVRYTKEHQKLWDQFVDDSKNGTFLFKRAYMDYHSDRFDDFSLLAYKNGKLLAVLPANIHDSTFYSHQGLTYGGLIMSMKIAISDVINIFECMNIYLKEHGLTNVFYKPTPYIYHRIPAQEDLYALYKCVDVRLVGRNISSTIYQNEHKLRFSELRRRGIRKSLNNGISISQNEDYESFWNILNMNLQNKYGVLPVHSLDEIKLLHSRFPDNIKLYMAYKGGIPLGGTLLYISTQVIHTQYISAGLEGKELGVLDLLFDYLINKEYINYPYFDFGQSTEKLGSVLNESLIFQKEGFGGRGLVYDIYAYNL